MKKIFINIFCIIAALSFVAAGISGETLSFATKSASGRSVALEVASEGAVLLKNDNNVLPLKEKSTVAVFGNAQIDYLCGGGGSSVMFTDYTVSPLDALERLETEGRLKIQQELKEKYRDYVGETSRLKAIWGTDAFYEKYVSESVEMTVSEEDFEKASEDCDTAIFFISRYATEGADMEAVEGGYYLSEAEKSIIRGMNKYFEKTVIILNIPSAIDLSLVAESGSELSVDGILCAWYPGEEGGNAVAGILIGDINPSGKLTQTFAKDITDYYSYNNWQNKKTVLYEEDIYVGYRQFETLNPDRVLYPFGFGLSYTTFGIKKCEVSVLTEENETVIQVLITVVNTGSVAGKEVLQVYYGVPGNIIDNPVAELGAFCKTPLLNPGGEATMKLVIPVNDMASYDDTGKIRKSAYVLEKGDYNIYVGNSVRDATSRAPFFTYNAEENIVTEQLSERCHSTKLTRRLTSSGDYEPVETAKPEKNEQVIAGYENPDEDYSGEMITLADVYNDESLMGKFLSQLTVEDMARLAGGTGGSAVGAAAGSFIGSVLEQYGGVEIYCTDGGQGLRVSTLATYFPSGTCLAASFNTELAERYGIVIGSEAAESDIDIWLGPGMNIIRNPLCGRNFEYYSEDPLVTGKIAAAVTKGVQSRNVGVCPKHYTANNMEENRGPQNSVVSERALREIYLKGFEILVKEGDPWMMMTTCGTVNSSGAAGNYDLMTAIPVEEWGWDGVFMSDWANMDGEVDELKAGHGLSMPTSSYKNLVQAEKKGKITRAQLEENSRRIIKLLLKLHSQKSALDPSYSLPEADLTPKEPAELVTGTGIAEETSGGGAGLYITAVAAVVAVAAVSSIIIVLSVKRRKNK